MIRHEFFCSVYELVPIDKLHVAEAWTFVARVTGVYHDGIREVIGVLLRLEEPQCDECLGSEMLPF